MTTRTDKLTDEDLEFFDKSVRGLIKFVLKVFDDKENLTRAQELIVRCLKKYKRGYFDSEPQEQLSSFVNLYKAHRISILSGPSKTKWIDKADNILFVDVDADQSEGDKESNVCIMLAPIYRFIKKVVDDTEEKFKGIDDDDVLSNCKELIYLDVFMLHLYRIFYCCSQCVDNVKTQQKLQDFIDEIEEDLGLNKEVAVPVDSNPMMALFNSIGGNPNGDNTANPMGNIAGMFNQLLTGLTANMGPQGNFIPPNPSGTSEPSVVSDSAVPPTPVNISETLSNLSNQPGVSNLLGTMTDELKNCNGDLSQLFGKIGSLLNNGELMKSFTGSMGQTAIGALGSNIHSPGVTQSSSVVQSSSISESPKQILGSSLVGVSNVSDSSVKYD